MLLLDDFKCHKQPEFVSKLAEYNTVSPLVPPHYTSILEPCDVGINKPLKDRLKKLANDWRAAKYATLYPGEKLPCPGRGEILGWLKQREREDNFIVELGGALLPKFNRG